MKNILCFIFLIVFSSSSQSQWCDYESQDLEPSRDESLFCPLEKTEIEFQEAIKKLNSTITKIKKNHPEHSDSFSSIEKNLMDLITKLEIYTKAKCEFDGYNFLYELSPASQGMDGGKYISICIESYKEEAIKEINKVIESCESIDEEFKLPCIK